MKLLSIILMIVVSGITLFIWWGKLQWTQCVDQKQTTLNQSSSITKEYVNLNEETKGLPAPVNKYFHLALKEGLPIIHQALVTQSGGFRAKPEMKGWSKMQATQQFTTSSRGFIWDSKITMIPGIYIRVCDSYIAGKGEIKGSILSAFSVIEDTDKPELNTGALQRYLAESVWFPTALLPSQGVEWKEIDSLHAEASITDAGTRVSLEFEFNEQGEIISVYTANRYREESGKYVATPWKGVFSDYTNIDGYRIPTHGEVAWHLKNQVYPYWKATLSNVIYR